MMSGHKRKLDCLICFYFVETDGISQLFNNPIVAVTYLNHTRFAVAY